ncbi:MAG: hypothetical protein AAGH15_26785 [Myxococcota bacterium]
MTNDPARGLAVLALATTLALGALVAQAQEFPPDYHVWSDVKQNLRSLAKNPDAHFEGGGIRLGSTHYWPVEEGSHELGASTEQGPHRLTQAAFQLLRSGEYQGGGEFEVGGETKVLGSPEQCPSGGCPVQVGDPP